MKSILSLLFLSALLFSCKKNDKESGYPPVAPDSLIARINTAGTVDLTWRDNSSKEDGFIIEKKTNGGNFIDIDTLPANTTSYLDADITSATYIYRIAAFNSLGRSASNTDTVVNILNSAPVLTTTAITAITNTSATTGGTITNTGGSAITARGVVWSTSANPTTALSTITNEGSGFGSFTSNITGLSSGTTYYVRSYATNATGTSYGDELTFTTTGTACNEATVPLTDILGNYTNTNETLGTSAYGPYTTTISSAVSTGPTSARIVVQNIWDNGWGPITFDLDWSNPANRTAIVVPQTAIPGSDAGDINPANAGSTISVQVPSTTLSSTPGTFSLCGQTFQLKMQLGVTGGGLFNALYTVNLAR